MLDPIYFQRLKTQSTQTGDSTVEIDSDPLPPKVYFKIIGYSQVNDFVLVNWRRGIEGVEEYTTGESLWNKDSPIGNTGGQLNLDGISSAITRQTGTTNLSVWDKVRIPDKGLTSLVAAMLRDPANYRALTIL